MLFRSEQAFVVPLSEKAIEILKRQKGKNPERVFTYKGLGVRRANTMAFKNACKRAGIDDFRWHDLRHTWATWHVQRGTPIEILQELGGWSDYKMVKRYAHFSHDHLKRYVQGSPNVVPTNSPTRLNYGQ